MSSSPPAALLRRIIAEALADISVGIELASSAPSNPSSLSSSSSGWRARAYASAAEAVRNGTASLEDPASTPGIGPSIARTIRRIVDAATGPSSSTEKERRRQQQQQQGVVVRARNEARRAVAEHAETRLLEAYREFRSILGVGDKKARELVLGAGLRYVRDLQERETRQAHGVDTPLVRLGLKYRAQLQQRVPLEDALGLVRRLKRALPGAERRLAASSPAATSSSTQLRLLPLGSVRRKKDTVGDLDLLLWNKHNDNDDNDDDDDDNNKEERMMTGEGSAATATAMAALRDAIAEVLGLDYVATLKCGARRLSFVARIRSEGNETGHRPRRRPQVCRVDVFGARDATERASFALYGTGSAEFNEAMRLHAKRQGYRLNEYGLFALQGGGLGKRVPLRSERDIFDALGMRYVPPRKRTGEHAVARSLILPVPSPSPLSPPGPGGRQDRRKEGKPVSSVASSSSLTPRP